MTVRLTQPPASLSQSPEQLAWLEQLARIVNASVASGTTANRPTSLVYEGRPYFDTTLNKPIWVKSITGATVDWIDATGASV
jgi:hypothetical protein